MIKLHYTSTNKGFTLVELLIALGIFSTVMVAALGSMFIVINSNKKARVTQLVMDNIHFAIDDMLRDIRTGDNYDYNEPVTTNACASYATFQFTNSDGRTVHYQCMSDSSGVNRIYKYEAGIGTFPITAPEVHIESLRFSVVEPRANIQQGSVFMILQGTAQISPSASTTFSLQTFVSQRKYQFEIFP